MLPLDYYCDNYKCIDCPMFKKCNEDIPEEILDPYHAEEEKR